MGFWHTGYIEHHEQAGLGENWTPRRALYRCQHCSAPFQAMEELRQHRFESHPYARPVMFVRGIELGASPFRITRNITESEFVFGKFEVATLNGHVIESQQLSQRLAGISQDRVQVELTSAGVSATYDLSFLIADEADLLKVEQSFMRLAKRRELSPSTVDRFIDDCEPFKTAATYVDGIAKYLYGILAKERASLLLPSNAYQDRFNAASSELADYDRPLSRLIQALVAFHFNHFGDAVGFAPEGRLRTAAINFQIALAGSGWKPSTTQNSRVSAPEELLTDADTHQILKWCEASESVLRRDVDQIAAAAKRESSTFNQLKSRILLVSALEAAGDVANARKAARSLHAYSDYIELAERIAARLKTQGVSNG